MKHRPWLWRVGRDPTNAPFALPACVIVSQSMLKTAARFALHDLGWLSVLRFRNRGKFVVPMFHTFCEENKPNVEALCDHITRHFEPISLSTIVDCLRGAKPLPANAISVTVDDGYRNFLLHGHPIFRRHRIPTTLFVVTGFAGGRFWLWTDQVAIGLSRTGLKHLSVHVDDASELDLPLNTPGERSVSATRLTEALKQIPELHRLKFMASFWKLCELEIPESPPPDRAAMGWEELRGVAREGVEIGCHTATHPILSRLTGRAELDCEIRDAKQEMEQRLGFAVPFLYPNGLAADICEAAINSVRSAGFDSAVTSSWGFGSGGLNLLQIRRVPLDSAIDFQYGVELLAGLHI